MGRPNIYSEELFDRICGLLAKGWSLAKICRQEEMPNPDTVYTWLRTTPGLSDRYARAKEDSADVLAEQINDIADTDPERDDAGKIDPGDVNNRRLRIDARKWVAAKLKPKKYGDRIANEISGADGQPIVINVVTGVPHNPNVT